MTIHFTPIPPRERKRCDTRALANARADTHRRLRDELDEERMSRQLVEKHNRHVRESRQYRQCGGE